MTDSGLRTAIDKIFAQWHGDSTPGCAVAVVKAGEVIHEAGYGLANLEHKVPIGSDTAFRVASLTKQFTCGVAMLLADAGKINLDANIREYLPEWSAEAPVVTVRQCMQNTSGIRDSLELLRLTGGELAAPHRVDDSFANIMRQRTTNFQPGTGYLYSNSNFLLLSVMIERVSGRSLQSLIDEWICRPLGMTRTAFVGSHDAVVENMATGYTVQPDGEMRVGQMRMALTGEGAIVSTLADMITWLRNYRDDKLNLIERLAVPARLGNGTTSGYAHGLVVTTYRGARSIGHTGLWPGYCSEIIYFPDADVGLVCLANASNLDPTLANRAIADMVIGDGFPRGNDTALDTRARKNLLSGSPYLNPRDGQLFEIAESQYGLQMNVYGHPVTLRAEDTRRLEAIQSVGELLAVEVPGNGSAALNSTWINESQIALIPAATLDPPKFTAEDYIGTFWSSEMNAGIQIEFKDGKLVARYVGGLPWGLEAPLCPTIEDVFLINTFAGLWPVRDYFRFDRDGNGAVAELIVTTNRVRALRYERRTQ